MATEAIITDAKWFYQSKNGDDFLLNPNDFTRNITGSIFENIKLVASIRIFTLIDIPSGLYGTNQSFRLDNAGFDNDINIGDICLFASSSSNDNMQFEVTAVNSSTIYFNLISNSGFTLPFTTGDPDQLYVINPLTFLRYDWGLVPNNDSSKFYRSYLDDNTTSFICENIGLGSVRDTNFVQGVKTAINSNPGSFKVRFIENSLSPIDQDSNDLIAQNFEIEHVFKIQDYSEENITNYINNTKPDAYLGVNTLNYNSNFEFRTTESNPETAKIGEFLSIGNVGFFGENFNGRPNNYFISDLIITRSSNNTELENIASSESSKVTFKINSIGDKFLSAPVIVLNHFAMVTDYAKPIDFNDLFFNSQLRLEGISTGSNGIITEGKILSFTDNQISVEFTINPGNSNLDNERYLLSVLVGDSSRDNISSDKVQLQIKTGVYQSGFDVEGLIGDYSLKLVQRNCDPYSVTGNSSMPLIQGEFCYTKFQFEVLGGLIDSIELLTINGNNEEIDSFTIDTTGFIIVNDEQEINEVLITPYSHGLNGVIRKISTGVYEVIFPYRMPFEKLIKVNGLSDQLFNQSEPNKGFNQSAFYQQQSGLDVKISYKVGMFAENRVTYYYFDSPNLLIKDFETSL